MVELKLSVALEEGTSAKGLVHSTGKVSVERIMPGLYVIAAPTGEVTAHFVVMTDDFDLSLLGFPMGDEKAAIILHSKDVETLTTHGIEVNLAGFEERDSLKGWHFRHFPWGTVSAVDVALRQIVPTYHASGLPETLPLEG
jgi:hypothetical protein